MAQSVSLIDTHCHLNFDGFDADRAEVLARAAAVGVRRVILPATDVADSRVIVGMVGRNNLFGAVGIHPNSTADFAPTLLDELAALAVMPGIVAIGEIGLDYHWDDSPKAKQFEALEAQLDLAARLGLPVIIHDREASTDSLAILETWARGLTGALRERPGVLHSVSAPFDLAMRGVECGFYLGFSGPITYKKSDNTRHLAAFAPLERLVVETDAPFLTPVPYRGQRNEPAYIPLIVDRIAAARSMTVEAVAAATTANAERLFNLPILAE